MDIEAEIQYLKSRVTSLEMSVPHLRNRVTAVETTLANVNRVVKLDDLMTKTIGGKPKVPPIEKIALEKLLQEQQPKEPPEVDLYDQAECHHLLAIAAAYGHLQQPNDKTSWWQEEYSRAEGNTWRLNLRVPRMVFYGENGEDLHMSFPGNPGHPSVTGMFLLGPSAKATLSSLKIYLQGVKR